MLATKMQVRPGPNVAAFSIGLGQPSCLILAFLEMQRQDFFFARPSVHGTKDLPVQIAQKRAHQDAGGG
jgi:hypothetical protein